MIAALKTRSGLAAMMLVVAAAAAAQETAAARVPDETAALAALRQIRNTMPPRPPQWHAVEVRHPVTGAPVTVYQTGEVTDSLEAQKQPYLEALREFPELKMYVEDAFALPTGSALGNAGIVSKKDADETWSLARTLGIRLTSLSELTVAVDIKTVPVHGAAFTMRSAGGTKNEESPTDGTLEKVYRGLYYYTITKEGYKQVRGSLDLVLHSTGMLTCTLVPTGVARNPLPCSFEER